MPNPHLDFSEVVTNHFAKTHELHPDVFSLSPDRVKELIDAVPDGSEIIKKLEDLLRTEGVCPITH